MARRMVSVGGTDEQRQPQARTTFHPFPGLRGLSSVLIIPVFHLPIIQVPISPRQTAQNVIPRATSLVDALIPKYRGNVTGMVKKAIEPKLSILPEFPQRHRAAGARRVGTFSPGDRGTAGPSRQAQGLHLYFKSVVLF